MEHRYITISTYIDKDGTEREIAVDVDAGGRFRVLDVAAAETLLVALLRGYDDDADRAMSCAEDYGTQIAEYLAGARDDMPCPHPLGRHPEKVTLTAPTADNPMCKRRRQAPAPDQGGQDSLLPAA
jgi:hypothetical protein